jgi:hypothetical protein
MSIFYTTYPFSIIAILAIIGIIIVFSFTNIILAGTLLSLAYMDCISLAPLIKVVDDVISVMFKNNLASIKRNINESFPLYGNKDFKGQAIFLFHPHGVFSLAHVFHVGCTITDWPYTKIKAAVHNALTSMPIMKDCMNHTNRCVASTYTDMKGVLLDGKSLSVALGGRSECKYLDPNKITAVIHPRRGIFKMAIETGVPLIPVLTYGENRIYKRMDSRVSDFLSYIFNFEFPLPTLSSLKDWSQIYKQPLENRITTYIGSAVEVGEARAPTDADIADLRDRYITAIKALYKDTHPDDYDAELEVV